MDYEQDEQEELFEEQATEPQAEDMKIDEDDAPYLDLRYDCERQAYAMIKNRSFGHTRAFDPDLLEKTGMDVDFARVWHAIGWDGFVPLRRMVLVSSPSSFFALFGRWTMVFLSDFLELNAILIGEILVTSLVLARACQFPLQKLAAVLIDMSFGV